MRDLTSALAALPGIIADALVRRLLTSPVFQIWLCRTTLLPWEFRSPSYAASTHHRVRPVPPVRRMPAAEAQRTARQPDYARTLTVQQALRLSLLMRLTLDTAQRTRHLPRSR